MKRIGFADIGNSRIKIAMLSEGYPGAAQVVTIGEEIEPFDLIVASMVGSEQDKNIALDYLSSVSGSVVSLSRTDLLPLINTRYTTIDTLGLDRIVAIYALYDIGEDYVVVDAGTAMTVDVVQAGCHLGGYIIPGANVQLQSLTQNASLPAVSRTLQGTDLGLNTQECIAYGVWSTLAAQIDRIALRFPEARLYLTGGDSEALAALIESDHVLVDNLVIKGLHRFWLEKLS